MRLRDERHLSRRCGRHGDLLVSFHKPTIRNRNQESGGGYESDPGVAEQSACPRGLQHSAHIEPGRDGLFNLIKSVPATLKYEPGVIVADGDFVIVHGRFSGPKSWIAADILRIVDGVLVEHWDVLQDEASQAESKSGLPMFGGSFTE